jgi:hypothetical protein
MASKKQISEYFSRMAKENHRKNPRPKSFYRDMVNKRWEKEKLSNKKK